MFPCPSPKGSNHAGLYLNRAGDLVDRNGALWGRRGTMAMDSLPESVRAPRVPTASDDAEHRTGMLRHVLRGYGLDDDSIQEACDICRRELAGEVSDDELPVAGPGGMGGRLSKETREGGEKHFRSPGHFSERPPLGTTATGEKRSMVGEADYRSSPASDGFARRYPDAMRIGAAVPGNSQFDGQHDRRTRRTRQLAADAASPDAGDRLAEKFGEHAASVGVGEWPSRR
jgi:hypothetical protein